MTNLKKLYLAFIQKDKSAFYEHLPQLTEHIKNHDTQKVKAILDKGFDIDMKTRDGITLLHMACEANSSETVELILGYKPQTYTPDKWNRTPLTILGYTRIKDLPEDTRQEAKRETAKCARMLLDYGMPHNERDNTDRTALIWAAINDNDVLGQCLMSYPQTQVQLQDRGGVDALLNSFYHDSHNFYDMLTHCARNSQELKYFIQYTRVAYGFESEKAKDMERLLLPMQLQEDLPEKVATKARKI